MNHKISSRLRHLQALKDDTFYDVKVMLTVRFWAGDEETALEQFKDCEIELMGPMHSFSVGFPAAIKPVQKQ